MGTTVTVSHHLCSSPYHKGPRWLLAVYFYRNARHKTGLQSYCMTCTKIGMRAANLSEKTKRNRHEYSRRYKEAQRRASGVPRRNLSNSRFDGKKLYAYLQQFITEEAKSKNGEPDIRLNGRLTTENDRRYLFNLRDNIVRARLDTIDQLAVDYDLPLWEMIEAAGRYKEDVRSRRKRYKKNL